MSSHHLSKAKDEKRKRALRARKFDIPDQFPAKTQKGFEHSGQPLATLKPI